MKTIGIVINKEEDKELVTKALKQKGVDKIIVLCNGTQPGKLLNLRDKNPKIKLEVMSKQVEGYAEEIIRGTNKEAEILKAKLGQREEKV